jgi:hypothetical protein
MQPKTDQDYQKLLTEVIRKQIVILGPAITLAKARNVQGLTVTDDGTVTAISGNPQAITQQLVDQFMELSGLIVKKTMEPLLGNSSLLTSSPTPTQNAQTGTPANPKT